MSLKDASAYNVQFLRGRPVLIDTLSFEPLRPGPWVAYRQFCQHFYAPLLLVEPRPTPARAAVAGLHRRRAAAARVEAAAGATWLRRGPADARASPRQGRSSG